MLRGILRKMFADEDKHAYELITPIIAEIMVAQSAYNNLYKAILDVSSKNYEEVSRVLRHCLEQNLNGVYVEKSLNKVLREHPDLLNTIIHVVQNTPKQGVNPEETLMFFRTLESKARMRYREYTLKLNSMVSVFFFYVFLVPTPVVLASGLSPEASAVLFSAFLIVSMIVFRVFFNKIGRIRGVLLG